MTAPLSGIKVIELARVLAGPWVGQTLADLGAEVTKIESPEGDDTRHWGPPFVDHDGDRSAAYYHATNRGKSSQVVDLKDAGALKALKEQIQSADVFIENFKLGGLKRFGLDYETLSALNPRLIYCSITGFGQTGPYAHRPGYDFMIQGMSGIMDLTGEPDGPPQKMGVAFADVFTGMYGVIAVQAALLERERSGLGQHVDLALLDCMIAVQANQNMNYLTTGESPKRMGNAHPNITPYQVFDVSDGHIIIACGNTGQVHRLGQVLGLDALITAPDYQTSAGRVANRATMIPMIQEALLHWTKSDILSALETAVVPAGPINSVAEALNDPHVKARGLEIAPQGVPGIRTPIRFSRSELALDHASPGLGKPKAKES